MARMPTYRWRGAPSLERISADRSMLSGPAAPAPAPPWLGLPIDAGLSRFSPVGAAEREAIDAFCAETRPWALRQAKRSYGHLPVALREQAVDRALQELRKRAPRSIDRRTLTAELADLLTESLRHVHGGWYLTESRAQPHRVDLESVTAEAARDDLGGFLGKGLGGLERAVLQLEIGAGRDSRTTRAALRLGPIQYALHRRQGLSKLRDAVASRVIGRACDQHVSSVVAAATGDRYAMYGLASGPDRCRACAREAQGMRGILQERLAVAPWPLAIKPAGLLVAKLAAVGALLGGKSAAGGTGFAAALGASVGTGAGATATVLAAATLATGTASVVDGGASPRPPAVRHHARVARAPGPRATPEPAKTVATAPASTTAVPKAFRTLAAAARKADGHRAVGGAQRFPVKHRGRPSPGSGTPAPDAPATATPAVPAVPENPTAGVSPVKKTIEEATDNVRQTVDQVTSQLPQPVAKPVDDAVAVVQDTVEQVTNTVDGLLIPKK